MDGWIVVRNWDRFQHYSDRNPAWVKLYTDLNSNDDWCDLSTAARGMLTTIWVEYARSSGHLPLWKAMQLCGKSARSAHVDALIHAGFIQVVASKPLALARSREKRREEKKDLKILATPPKAKEPEPDPASPTSGREHRPYDKPTDSLATIRRLIGRTIHDNVDLDVELRSGDHHLTQTQITELRALL